MKTLSQEEHKEVVCPLCGTSTTLKKDAEIKQQVDKQEEDCLTYFHTSFLSRCKENCTEAQKQNNHQLLSVKT